MFSVLLELKEYTLMINLLWLLQDSFYRGLTAKELEDVHEYNFDHPGKFLYILNHMISVDLKSERSWTVIFTILLSIQMHLIRNNFWIAFASSSLDSLFMFQYMILRLINVVLIVFDRYSWISHAELI